MARRSVSKQVESHKTNGKIEYCLYCGNPGVCYMLMIQCSACHQWFHEGCVKCLSYPLLYGDHFYIFICSTCNSGIEYVGRLQVTWLELIHLVLFHLTIKYRSKYFDLEVEVLPWTSDNWKTLQAGKLEFTTVNGCRENFLRVLHSNPDRFKNGCEIRKRRSWWALRVRCPPASPVYKLPLCGVALNDFEVNQFLATQSHCTDWKNEKLQPVKLLQSHKAEDDEYYQKWKKRLLLHPKSSHMHDEKKKVFAKKLHGLINQPFSQFSVVKEKIASQCHLCRSHKQSDIGVQNVRKSSLKKSLKLVPAVLSHRDHRPKCSRKSRQFHCSNGAASQNYKGYVGLVSSYSVTNVSAKKKRGRPSNSSKQHQKLPKFKDDLDHCDENISQVTYAYLNCQQQNITRPFLGNVKWFSGSKQDLVAERENCQIFARRLSSEGQAQYLLLWGAICK